MKSFSRIQTIKDLYSNHLALHQNKKYDDLEESPHGNDLF